MSDVPISLYTSVVKLTGENVAPPSLPPSLEETQPAINPPGTSDISGLVPYNGAIDNVNLGEKGLSTGFVQYDNTPTDTPTGAGTVVWNPDKYTLDLSMGLSDSVQQIGMETYYTPVKNQTGSLIPDGTFVMATGSLGASGRITIAPAVTDGSVDSRYMLGVTTHDIADGEDGLVTWFGEIRGFNTNTKAPVGETWVDGTVLWNNPAVAGGFTSVEPQAPSLKIPVAIVISAGNNGVIFVRPRLGMRLTDLHDVDAFTPSDKDLISYDSALGHWNAKSLGSVIGGTSSQFLKGDGSLDSNSYALASQINIATGQVAFGTGSNTIGGDSGLTWDNVSKRLGVGDSSPSYPISVAGDIIMSGSVTRSLRVGDGRIFAYDFAGKVAFFGGVDSGIQTVIFRTAGTDKLRITSTGLVGIATTSPTNTLDVNGTARIRTLSNATGDFVTASATGVLQKRTASEVLTDIGGIGGTIASGQVAFGTGVNTIGGDSGLVWDNTTKVFTAIGQQIFQGSTASDTAPLGTELATTGSGTNWTGSDFATGYTHTIGSTAPLNTSTPAVSGTYYQIAYTVTGRTTGSFTINYGGSSTSGLTATGSTGPLASSTANLEIVPTIDFNGTIVLSVRTIGISLATTTFNDSTGVARIQIRATTTSSNTLVGNNAGRRITTGSSNSFFGQNAGLNNTTGINNSFFGVSSGQSNTTGGFNSFFGRATGQNNATGSSNSFFGASAGFNNTTGSSNSFFGQNAGATNTTGVNNSFIGASAGENNTTGVNNSFFGRSSGQNNTTGDSNSFVGVTSGRNNTTGSSNSFFGQNAGFNNTTGSSNSFFGASAGENNTTGVNNLFLGFNSGRRISSGSNLTIVNNSLFLGVDTRANADNESNQIVIGYTAIGGGSNTTTIGNSSTVSTRIPAGSLWVNTTSGTNTLDVNGTARIRTLTGTTGYLPLLSSTGVMGQSVVYNTSSGSVLIGTINEVSGHKVRISGGALNITNWQSSAGAYDKLSIDFGEFRGIGYDADYNEVFFAGTTTVPVKIDTDAPTDSLVINANGNVSVGGQLHSPVVAKGSSSTAVTFDWNDGNIQTVTLTANCTFTFSNPQSGASYQIIITQDATGGRIITWPVGIYWEGKSIPALTGTANSRDIVTITYDGTNYNALIARNFGT